MANVNLTAFDEFMSESIKVATDFTILADSLKWNIHSSCGKITICSPSEAESHLSFNTAEGGVDSGRSPIADIATAENNECQMKNDIH